MKISFARALYTAATGLVALALSTTAQAVPTLNISQTGGVGGPITVTDEAFGDFSLGVPGSVLWTGSIGFWSVVVTSGTTKPVNGSATTAQMHLGVTATSTGAGVPTTLTVAFSEIGYGPVTLTPYKVDSSTTIDSGPSNTGENTVTTAEFDAGNVLFGSGSLLATSTFTTPPGAQSANQLSSGQTAALYSLTSTITISHNANVGPDARTTSGSIDIMQAPDGGFTLSLLGSAMVGLVALRRKLMV